MHAACGPLWWSKDEAKGSGASSSGVKCGAVMPRAPLPPICIEVTKRRRGAAACTRSRRYPRRPHPRSLPLALYPSSHFFLLSFFLADEERNDSFSDISTALDQKCICIPATRLLHLRDPRLVRLLETCILPYIGRKMRSAQF